MSQNELSITVITREEGEGLLYGTDGDILYSNMKSYCDKKSLTKLKKVLGIESRRKIRYVITHTDKHPDFKCKQNKKIKYKNGVFCDDDWEGAEIWDAPSLIHLKLTGPKSITYHPYGDIFIALENDPELKKQEKEMKKMKKQITDRIKKITEIETLKEMLDA
jgi:hypothetical protein